MLRLIIRGSIQSFSKQLQASKKLKPLQKAQKAKKATQLQFKQRLAALHQKERITKMYLQFQATPTDPLSIIRQRFIRKKRLLSNRRLYMPNKRQYTLLLDRHMKEIQQIHEEQLVRQSYGIPKTIGEKIAIELEHQKFKSYFNFFRDDIIVIKLSFFIILILSFYQAAFCHV